MDRELFLQLLRGIIPGAFIGCAFILELFWKSRPTQLDQPSPRQIFAPVFIALALVGSFAFAFPLRTPSGLFDWLGWMPIPLALIGIAITLAPWRIGAIFIALFGLAAALLFAPRAEWTGVDLKSFTLAIFASSGAAALVHPVWERRPLLLFAVATIAAGGMSQVLILGFHALKLGQVAGIGASMLGGMAVAALLMVRLRKSSAISSHVIAPLAIMALLFAASALAQGPIVTETRLDWVLVLLLASIPAAATGAIMLLQRKSTVVVWISTLIAAGGPVALAMLIVLMTREPDTSGY